MNEELKKLYDSKWNELCSALKPIIEGEQYKNKPAYPLLLDIGKWENDKQDESWYADADIRVMIFGQETNPNGWKCGDKPEIPLTSAFNLEVCPGAISGVYADMCQWELHNNLNYNGSKSLFTGFKNFMSMLNQKFSGKKIGYVYNNIVKIGKSEGTGFDTQIYNIEQKHFRVIPQEVEILKPHIIIFMTGGYDEKIKDNFGEVTSSPIASFAANEVAKVELPNVNALAYRTYHPSARNISNEKREEYYKAIIEDINL